MTMAAQRQESNREIIRLLSEMVEQHAEQRFGQLLINFGVLQLEMTETEQPAHEKPRVSDPFYEESSATLKRLLKIRQSGSLR